MLWCKRVCQCACTISSLLAVMPSLIVTAAPVANDAHLTYLRKRTPLTSYFAFHPRSRRPRASRQMSSYCLTHRQARRVSTVPRRLPCLIPFWPRCTRMIGFICWLST